MPDKLRFSELRRQVGKLRFPKPVTDKKVVPGYSGVEMGIAMVNGKWVRARLKQLKKTQLQLGEAMGVTPSRVVEVLNGTRRLQFIEASKMADFIEVPLPDVARNFGVALSGSYGKLAIRGYIDANSGTIISRGGELSQGDLEEIDAPFPGYQGCAVRIKGSSMAPRYRDGEVVGYTPNGRDISEMINQEVIAEVEDGRVVLKVLHRGTRAGLWTLSSLNPSDSPILDVPLSWAALIDFHLPRKS